MRTAAILVFLVIDFAWLSPASADWLVLRNGQRSEVSAVQIGDRSVVTLTWNGKTWSLPIDAVDVARTRALNGMSEGEQLSPGWPRDEGPGGEKHRRSPPPPREPTVRRPAPTEIAPKPAPSVPPPSTPPRPEETTPLPPAGEANPTRLALFANGVVGSTDFGFTEARSYVLFNETATLDVDYRESTRPGYELGVLVRIRGPVGIVASAEQFERAPNAFYRNRLPHPFFYDRLREVAGEEASLSWSERAIHLDPVVSLDLGSRLTLDFFSGVSFFFTERELIDEVLYEEVFPYESVVSQGATVRLIEERPIGFNLGASTTLRLIGPLAVDFGLRYSRAELDLALGEDREVRFVAGGLRLGAGLRVLIP